MQFNVGELAAQSSDCDDDGFPNARSSHCRDPQDTAAILKMMGVTETIASTIDEYVSTAIHLARDVPRRMAVKNKISENKHRVYRDTTCISALEDFLIRTTRGESGGHRVPVD